MAKAIRYNVDLFLQDMAVRGWRAADVARATGLSKNAVGRFLGRHVHSPKTAKKLAGALRKPISRYLPGAVEPSRASSTSVSAARS
jgi:transcriptional regulator with XRE-family HTH domain